MNNLLNNALFFAELAVAAFVVAPAVAFSLLLWLLGYPIP